MKINLCTKNIELLQARNYILKRTDKLLEAAEKVREENPDTSFILQ